MVRLRTPRVVGVAAVVGLVLAIASAGQIQAGGPVRWQVTLPTVESGLIAVGNPLYVGGVDGVNITNGTSTCGSGQDKTYYSYLRMEVAQPRQVQFLVDPAYFQTTDPNAAVHPTPAFPGVASDLRWPQNAAEFLLLPQPYDGDAGGFEYQYVRITFSSRACEDRDGSNFLTMPIGGILRAKLAISVFSHTWVCPPDTTNRDYNLSLNARGWVKDAGALPDIYVERTSATTWVARVNTLFDNPEYQREEYPLSQDFITGQYLLCTQKIVKGRTTWTHQYVNPYAKAPLQFEVTFTKR